MILNISGIEYCRYLDPEYFLRRQLTTASDVYAYGVCLMELITGQQSIDHMRLEEYNLVEWVSSHMIPSFRNAFRIEVTSKLGMARKHMYA